MKKVLSLLTLLLAVCSGAWAADHVVTATRTLSNSNKTSNWTAIRANGGSAFQSSATALGEGLYFVAVGKITLDGGNSLNVKANGEMYLEVPSSTAEGTVTFTNGANNRYMETPSGGQVHMKGDADNGDMKAKLAFNSDDIVAIDGVNYLKLTSKSDCKFKTVEITLTSGKYMTILANPEITVNGATAKATITPPANASSVRYTLDGTEPSASNGTVYAGEFDITEGAIIKAIAIGDGESYANSSVASKQALLTGIKISTPTSSQYNGTILLETTSPSAKIYYTTDGTDPSSSSTLYTIPFTLNTNSTVKAVALRDGCTNSDVLTVNVVAITNTKVKTVTIGWGSLEGSGKALRGKAGDEAEGFGLACGNDLQSGNQKNTVINKTYIKIPNGNQVTISLPDNVAATKITFYSFINSATSSAVCGWKEVNGTNYQTGDGDYKNIPMGNFSDITGFVDNPDVRSYPLDNVTGSITFTNAGVQVCTLIAIDVIEAVSVSSAGYATYVLPNDVDFNDVTGVTAYVAKASGDAIILKKVDAAPASTPLLIEAAEGTYAMPTAAVTPAPVSENDLVAGPVTGDGTSYYVLGKEADTVGFGLLADGVVLSATKAYIPAAKFSSGARFYTFFNSETTGINNVEKSNQTVDGVFNLNGQRVAQPTKGLYIVNGKKYIVK